MRVLIACEFYYPSVGGVQEVMRQIAERLVERGHEVTVATTYLPDRSSRLINGVHVEEFRVSGNMVRGMKGEVARYQHFLVHAPHDVFLVKAAQQWTFDALTPILDQIGMPKIFVPCGFSGLFDPDYKDYFLTMPRWLREFDRLIFYATEYRDVGFARNHGLQSIDIVPNGADEREFNVNPDEDFRVRMSIPPDAFVILTVGSLNGAKGHLELAKAFERCDFGERMAFLILNGNVQQHPSPFGLNETSVGRWWERAVAMYTSGGPIRVIKWIVRPIVIRLGLGQVLVLLGRQPPKESVADVLRRINATPGRRAIVTDLPRRELVQAYLNSNLFVFASHIEYSPLVLYEAAAAGLPFVSAPVGNAAEIADWTGAGLICPAAVDDHGLVHINLDALANLISDLSKEPSTLEQLGRNGRINWERKFTWEKISRRYEGILEACLRH